MNGRFHSGFCDMGEPAPLVGLGRRTFRMGELIFDEKQSRSQASVVASGEVVIMRDGRPVDIVGPGERLDPDLWPHATAIAWTECRLVSVF